MALLGHFHVRDWHNSQMFFFLLSLPNLESLASDPYALPNRNSSFISFAWLPSNPWIAYAWTWITTWISRTIAGHPWICTAYPWQSTDYYRRPERIPMDHQWISILSCFTRGVDEQNKRLRKEKTQSDKERGVWSACCWLSHTTGADEN